LVPQATDLVQHRVERHQGRSDPPTTRKGTSIGRSGSPEAHPDGLPGTSGPSGTSSGDFPIAARHARMATTETVIGRSPRQGISCRFTQSRAARSLMPSRAATSGILTHSPPGGSGGSSGGCSSSMLG
jgi:hypothetical protein